MKLSWKEIKLLVSISIFILAIMALFETIKQLLHPNITIIESHILTTIFTMILGTYASARTLIAHNTMQENLISRDHLTGLYNRHKIDELLEQTIEYSKRYKTGFAMIILDIDFFKPVNDEYGHQTGDSVLCEFANLLQTNMRANDHVGRWGGEEFLIILNNVDEDGLLKYAERLRALIETYDFSIVKHKTASFGATIYQLNEQINDLISRADNALYKAKNSGRNRVELL